MRILKEFQGFDLDAFLNAPDVQAFIGSDFDEYATMWRKDWAKKGDVRGISSSFHWNPVAFFLGPIVWYGYRKMYAHAFGLIALFSILNVIEAALYLDFGIGAFVGVCVVLALNAKSMYFFHVYKKIKKIRELPPDLQITTAAARGGASLASALAIAVIMLVSLFGSAVGGYYMFPHPELPTLSDAITILQNAESGI